MAIDTKIHDAVEALLLAETAAAIQEWETRHELSEELFEYFLTRLNRLLQDRRSLAHQTVDFFLRKAGERNNLEWQGRLLVRKAHLHLFDADVEQALSVVNKAISILESTDNRIHAVRARLTRLQIFLRLGMSREGLAELPEMEHAAEELNDPRTAEGVALGCALVYQSVGRFEEAVPAWKRGIELALEQNDLDNAFLSYGNLAYGLTQLNRVDEALACYETAIDYANRHGFSMRTSVFTYFRAHLFFFQGRYREALEGFKTARANLEQNRFNFETATVDMFESELHVECNSFEKAIALAQSAHREFSRLGARQGVARALILEGYSEGQLGHYEKADFLLLEAKAMLREQMNFSRAANADLYRARLFLQNGRISSAKEAAEEARAVFDQERLFGKAAFARTLIARSRMTENDLAGAWDAAHEAARLNAKSPSPWLSLQLHQLIGDLYYREGKPQQARFAYLEALEESEKLRGNLTQEENRLSFSQDKEALFQNVMKASFDLAGPAFTADAFDTLEKAKSRTLADLLTHSVSVVCGNTASGAAEQSYEDNSLLRLYESGAASTKPVSLAAIQKTLQPDAALIEYFVLNDRIGVFVVRHDRVEVLRELSYVAEVRRTITLLDFQFSRFRLGDGYTLKNCRNLSSIVSKQLRMLHAALFHPIEKWLRDCRTCLIVPHGALHRVPFHLLLDGDAYVIDKYAISYAPSATVYSLCSHRPDSPSKVPLIVGVEDPQIPGVAEEVSSLRKQWPQAHVLQNEAATLSGFRTQCENAAIIHIATHADFQLDNAMFSSIRLADRWINVADIYGLKMSADLVTLSACGTGLGSLKSGDEIIGLIRGFLYAGARCLLVSLWDVHDGSASELMRHFYEHVSNGRGFAEALQSSMSAARKKQPHPYYWGSFRLVGYAAPASKPGKW